MSKDPIRLPPNAQSLIDTHGAPWMKRSGVRGVGLAKRDHVLKFVILTDDATVKDEVPPTIAGFPTYVEPTTAKAAGRPRR